MDDSPDLVLTDLAPMSGNTRGVADTNHSNHGVGTAGLQSLTIRPQALLRNGVGSHLETVRQEDVSLAYKDGGQSWELSSHLQHHALQ